MSDQQLMRINLSLVSHTNIGKTTLARTLLGRDIGEVAAARNLFFGIRRGSVTV